MLIRKKTNFRDLTFLLSLILSVSVLVTSCINGLPGEAVMPESGDTPIFISAIQNTGSSFIAEENFKDKDKIGLYLTIRPSTLQNTRYIDNMCHTYSSNNGFVPNEIVFFPEGKNPCDFFAYYPYQNKGIVKGGAGIEVKVPTDQSSLKGLSDIDFMTATAIGIEASETAVNLEFEHKLFCYNIQLKVESGYTLESLLNINPVVKIKNVYTKATYDFSKDKFINHNTKSDIIPYGAWTIKDNLLCGKSAIIIPQTLSESHIVIELHVDDRIYECNYTQAYTLESGKVEENTITLLSSGDAAKINITTSVNGWNVDKNTMEASERVSFIQIEKLNFAGSNVLKVMNKDKQVAEICKEYLCGNDIKSQVIVIYPMSNEKADLTKGMVIEVIGETGAKHGGSVNWNTTDNQFAYTEGTSAVPAYIYITKDGEIKTMRPADALQLELVADRLTDIRGDETFEYPMTKIGTQYWMRINLKPTKYIDGTSIEAGTTTVSKEAAQYYHYLNTYYFYNAAAVATGKLIPNGWRIGNETDYTKLKTYIKNNASVLKNGNSWKGSNSDVSNLTSFNAVATGYFKPTYLYNEKYTAYWCAQDKTSNNVDKVVILNADDNNIKIENTTSETAATLKCIRE